MRKVIVVSLMLAVCICGLFYGDVIAQQVTRGVQVITGDLRVGGDIYGLDALDIGGTFTGVNQTLAGRLTASSADVDTVKRGIGGEVVVDDSLKVTGHQTGVTATLSGLLTAGSGSVTGTLTAGTMTPTILVLTQKTPVNAVTAKDTLTSDETVPTAGDTLKVGNITYTFADTLTVTYAPEDSSQTTPLYTANEIIIGETYDVTLANIRLAINATDQDTTTYAPGTVANPLVEAGTIASTALPLAARTAGVAGNSIALVSESAHLTEASETFTGGVDGTVGVANELCVDDSCLYHCTATNTISGANWRRVALGSVY